MSHRGVAGWQPGNRVGDRSAVGENHVGLFEVEAPSQLAFKGGTKLTVTLDFQFNTKHALGHFRLAVSGDPVVPDRELKRFAATRITDPWQKLAAAYRVQGKSEEIDQLVSRRPELAGRIGDLFVQGADADKDWQRAVAIYSLGIIKEATDVELLSKRARAFETLKDWDSSAADWSRAAGGGNHDEPKLLADFARRLAANGQASREGSVRQVPDTLRKLARSGP